MEIQIEKTDDPKVIAKLNESVQTLHHKLYPLEFKKFDLPSVTGALQRMMSSPKSHTFIAKKDNYPIGYTLCIVNNRDENEFQYAKTILYIDQISVDQEFKSQGVGQLLLAKAVELAKELGINEIQLDHWNDNESAKNFFRTAGFKIFNSKCSMKITT